MTWPKAFVLSVIWLSVSAAVIANRAPVEAFGACVIATFIALFFDD